MLQQKITTKKIATTIVKVIPLTHPLEIWCTKLKLLAIPRTEPLVVKPYVIKPT